MLTSSTNEAFIEIEGLYKESLQSQLADALAKRKASLEKLNAVKQEGFVQKKAPTSKEAPKRPLPPIPAEPLEQSYKKTFPVSEQQKNVQHEKVIYANSPIDIKNRPLPPIPQEKKQKPAAEVEQKSEYSNLKEYKQQKIEVTPSENEFFSTKPSGIKVTFNHVEGTEASICCATFKLRNTFVKINDGLRKANDRIKNLPHLTREGKELLMNEKAIVLEVITRKSLLRKAERFVFIIPGGNFSMKSLKNIRNFTKAGRSSFIRAAQAGFSFRDLKNSTFINYSKGSVMKSEEILFINSQGEIIRAVDAFNSYRQSTVRNN